MPKRRNSVHMRCLNVEGFTTPVKTGSLRHSAPLICNDELRPKIRSVAVKHAPTKQDNENARTIFQAPTLVKIFCKGLCKGGQNAGGGILVREGGVELTKVTSIPLCFCGGELVFRKLAFSFCGSPQLVRFNGNDETHQNVSVRILCS